MPTATLSIPAAPEQVRTARLVAGAAARRAGVDPDVIDDVRLAVAEAVARAVLRGLAAGGEDQVDVVMTDDGSSFEIAVSDAVAQQLTDDEEALALSLMQALADESRVLDNESGGQTVVLTWATGSS
jgi:anti-sigma regulatory factor (Ser/Thr protein kinase)